MNWYPGHMAKAKRLIREQLRLCDLVFELADARIPHSSRNPLLREMVASKPRLLLLTKPDLADPSATREWLAIIGQEEQNTVLKFDAARGTRVRTILTTVHKVAQVQLKGKKNIRAVVIGIPNVGKSSFINRLSGQKVAATGRKPGVTKGKQWVRVSDWLELLDTPGTLWPRSESEETDYRLAATGAIPENNIGCEALAFWIIDWLRSNNLNSLRRRYKLCAVPGENAELLSMIGRQRGLLQTGGQVDIQKTAVSLITDFRSGKLGRFTLDKPENNYEIRP